ncbi:MAG TPA: cbb3-type cytochrome c oxidase N-terminal domain-containing protein, partial [Cyclobacteriaceae bacterium]|nr:cbb3-type cytochrome c oxidase N-terminal domain-containing protein [Cyclobacteriaceae bacterium]
MKKIFISLASILLSVGVFAQDVAPAKKFWDDPINDPMAPLYAVSTVVFIVLVLVIAVAIYMLRIINLFTHQVEKERASKEGKVYMPRPSLWSKMIQSLNASVPVAHEQDIDLGHNFDGIRELDNHLPPWWKYLFYATIAWGVVYLVIYHVSYSMPLSIEEYSNEITLAKEQSDKLKASQPAAVIDENKLVYSADAAILEKGKTVFNNNCVACHRADGGGNTIGPNLTDEYWIHGGGIKNVFSTIKNGKVDKGMPEWGKAMSAQDVRDVAFFVMSLKGTNPANGKAPQGELYKPDENVKVMS